MANPSNAELRRLAENAEGSFGQFDPSESEQEFMARITPAAVLSILDELDAKDNTLLVLTTRHFAESWSRLSTDAKLDEYLSAGIAQLQEERDAALAEIDVLSIQVGTLTEWYSNALDVIGEVTTAIPGTIYMDPPDGGDVSIPEQIRRMAKYAERYRWLLENAVSSYSGEQLPVLVCRFDLPVDGWRDEVSRRIDAAMSREAAHD